MQMLENVPLHTCLHAISLCTSELPKSESLIRKVQALCWYSGNSSLYISMHIKLHKQPTHTLCSNKWEAKAGTTSWRTHLAWPNSQLYNNKLPTISNHHKVMSLILILPLNFRFPWPDFYICHEAFSGCNSDYNKKFLLGYYAV